LVVHFYAVAQTFFSLVGFAGFGASCWGDLGGNAAGLFAGSVSGAIEGSWGRHCVGRKILDKGLELWQNIPEQKPNIKAIGS